VIFFGGNNIILPPREGEKRPMIAEILESKGSDHQTIQWRGVGFGEMKKDAAAQRNTGEKK